MGKALIRSLMYIVNKNYEVTFDLSMFTQCILKPSLRNVFLYSLSGVPDYFDRNKISSGGDLSHYSSASLY